MITNKEVAKKKQCPLGALAVMAMISAVEIPAHWPDVMLCSASKCMAWRNSRKVPEAGYCGLAGIPTGEEERI